MKKIISVLLILMLIIGVVSFTSCKKDESESTSSEGNEAIADSNDNESIEDELLKDSLVEIESNGISYNEEQEGAELQKVPSDASMYIGSWTAPSNMAQFLYGNVDLTVKEDGTWKANITDEELGGKWTDEGDHLHMQNKMFSFDLAFNTSGKLILIEKNSDGELHTVLVRK